MLTILYFIAGLITMGYLAAGLFFLRFWKRTHDRLFLAFAGAFWLLAASQGMAVLIDAPREELSWVYLLRVAAFTLIIYAIVSKNFETKKSNRGNGRR